MACGNLEYYPLVAWILRIYPVLPEFIEKNGKSGKRLDMASQQDKFHLKDDFSEGALFFYNSLKKMENRGKLD